MRTKAKRLLSLLLICLFMILLFPILSLAAFDANVSNGDILFTGESDEPRSLVSETSYSLTDGVTEYVTYTNEENGLNQNIDYFCEVDLSKVQIMAGYPGMDDILSGKGASWQMQGVSNQVKDAQGYYDRTAGYENYQIVAALNGDYYNMATGEPQGALVINGEIYHAAAGGYFYFAIDKNGKALISDNSDLSNLQQAVGGSVLLVKNGEVNVAPGGRNVTYTAIGIKADGNVVAMVCHGQSYPVSCGYTQYEVAQMMKARGCVNALLLDGSGSSTYVSRHEGEKAVSIRNNPSDGMERMTTSSIMIVSTTRSDGVFHHAAVEPKDLVYTPGSSVRFTAVGADAAGGPAPLPSDLTWTIADSAFGTIDGRSGLFRSNGACGSVTIQANYGGNVVGESTILIQQPDQLIFSDESVSIGFGDSSDLGLQARFEGRNVICKDGDLNWSISDHTMGSFEGNVFHASETASLTGTATVTSVWDETVSATVQVEVGKKPIIAMDFEGGSHQILHGTTTDGAGDIIGVFQNGSYTTDANAVASERENADMICVSYTGRNTHGQPQVGMASIVKQSDGAPVRSGSYALKLDYDFTDNANVTDGVCFGYNKDIVLEGDPTHIGIWVFVPDGTPNLWLRLRYSAGGNTSQIDFTPQPKDTIAIKDSGLAPYADGTWHYFEADISSLPKPVTIPAGMSLRVMFAPGINMGYTLKDGTTIDKSECHGSLYFDNLTYIFGSNDEDTLPPVITSCTINGQLASDGMVLANNTLAVKAYAEDKTGSGAARFNTGLNLSTSHLYVDGYLLQDALSDSGEGSLRHDNIVLSNGEHVVKVVMTDNYGNETIRTWRVTVAAPGNAESPVTLSAGKAVVGETVTVDFTARSATDIDAMAVSLHINKEYKNGFTLTPGPGYEVSEEAEYDPVSQTVSFALRRTAGGNTGTSLCSLNFPVPAGAAQGTSFSCYVTSGSVTYADEYAGKELGVFAGPVLTAEVASSYTVSSDPLVNGMPGQFFQVSNAEGGPIADVTLYDAANDHVIGTSDNMGHVPYSPAGAGNISVYAKDSVGNVSFVYTTTIFEAKGNADGTPTLIFTNTSETPSSEKNISWLSNPLHAKAAAVLQLAETEDGVGTGERRVGNCRLAGFTTDKSAAYACGITLTGLAEGKTYYYRVGDGEEGHWSPVRSFTVPYAGGDTDILIFGDLQEQNNSNITGILSSLNLSRFDLAIQTGDLVDNGGNYGYWASSQENLAALDGTDRLNSLGNHEYEGGFDVSGLLYNRDKPYYSMTYGNTYIATIGYCGSTADYQEALNWLIQDAKQSTAAWKILVTHQPPYYTNTTGGNSGVNAIFPPAVESAGIDLVLSGHDHSYARTEPLKNGAVDEENGITYFICGSLGEKAYAATDNPNFHFAKMDDSFNAVYLTLSASENALTVTAYDYTGGKSEVLDTWSKTRSNTHTHSYTWDGQSRLTCDCGYTRNAAEYTGYAFYTVDGKDGRVYLHLGVPQKGVFAAGDEVLHAGDDGLLHNSETVSTATCTEDGYLCCLCHDDNTLYQLSEKRYTGHNWDENHVCTNRVFNLETMQYEVCGYHGRDISRLPVTLGYLYGFYTGEARRPSVTVTDTLDNGTKYKLICQSTYGDCVPYYSDNIDVGHATIRIEGYGNYYGEQTVHFDIVPNNVKTIEAAEITGNSVTLEWESAKGAEEYIVYQNIAGTWTRLGITKETSYIATGLEAGEQQFRIRPRAEVNGEYFHSTKNSDILTVQVSGNGITFSEGGRITKTYGDEPFTNTASLKDQPGGFTYASSDPSVATVDAQTGEVTILRAGTAIITAARDDLSGQYRLTVQPLTVGLVWNGGEPRVYDGNASSVTATATGVLDGDTVQVTVSGGDAKDAGAHTAQAALDNANYALPTEQSLRYTITPRPLTLTWSGTELTYSGRELAPTATGNEVVTGDSVLFSVKGAVEPGTYKVTAVSTNPNYVVEDGQETTYTITMPEVYVTGSSDDKLTCYIDGTTIYVVGSTKNEVVVTAKNAKGTASSTTVSLLNPISSITLGNIRYDVDASGLVQLTIGVNLGETSASIDAELDETAASEVSDSIADDSNAFSNIVASIAGHVEALAAGEVPADAQNVSLTVSMQLSVTDYAPGEYYTVELKPMFTVEADDFTGETKELSNAHINAPILVTLKLPASMMPAADADLDSIYIRHRLADGTIEYIKPINIDTQNGTVSFYASSFSEFTVYNDARSVSVLFNFEDGSVQTRTFGPADIGKFLPNDTKENATFNGWTIDGKLYTTLEEPLLNSESLLTAKPSFTSNSSGGNISVGGGGSSKPPVEEVKNPFADITEVAWFYDAVMYVYSNGLFQGVTDTTFEPVTTMTRAMLVTVLYRMDGTPASTAENPFSDVAANAWYTDAVVWAADKGLVNGYGGGLFGPDDPVTREQMASILFGYAKQKGLSTEAGGDLSAFKDGDSVSAWALDGIRWAVGAGLMQGKDGGILDPLGTATRAEVATMLMRFHENILSH